MSGAVAVLTHKTRSATIALGTVKTAVGGVVGGVVGMAVGTAGTAGAVAAMKIPVKKRDLTDMCLANAANVGGGGGVGTGSGANIKPSTQLAGTAAQVRT